MTKIPSAEDILKWVSENPHKSTKRDIARAFGIRGNDKVALKNVLRELKANGQLETRRKKTREAGDLAPVMVLRISSLTADGDLTAVPNDHRQGKGLGPIHVVEHKDGPALAKGDRILAKMKAAGDVIEARIIRKIETSANRILGIFRSTHEGGRISPIDKGADKQWKVHASATQGAKDGELVEAEQTGPKGRLGLPSAKIIERLGDPSAAKSVSLIAIHQHEIPYEFPDAVLSEVENAVEPNLKGRTDLTHLPLVTIDPADARDRDDAVLAQHDPDPKNPGGFILWVAIADVAHFVTPGSALDEEARKRGNSTYFPDRVVPMLPDKLSGDLCSLHAKVPRACMAVEMKISADGEKLSHQFHRGLLNSPAACAYEMVQDAINGSPNDITAPLLEPVLKPLFAAYDCLKRARENRQPLDLDLPERRVEVDEDGHVKSVKFKDRLDAHRLIEEFMVLANVAAAETLVTKGKPLMFRVHEEPNQEKLEALRQVAKTAGLPLAKGQVLQTRHLNGLLKAARGTDDSEVISMATLRSMAQAYYSPDNKGHFGLALRNYAHFTSPIRRYADLIVHRALISAHGWGDDGLSASDIEHLEQTANLISDTERRSMLAERDTTDRYLASYLSERLGNEFTGRIAGIAKFGAFLKLDETGADGLIPMRALGNEYFHHDREAQTLTGAESGLVIGLGQRATVRLAEATPMTGGVIFDLLELDNAQFKPKSKGWGRGSRPKGKSGKKKRIVKRTRR